MEAPLCQSPESKLTQAQNLPRARHPVEATRGTQITVPSGTVEEWPGAREQGKEFVPPDCGHWSAWTAQP